MYGCVNNLVVFIVLIRISTDLSESEESLSTLSVRNSESEKSSGKDSESGVQDTFLKLLLQQTVGLVVKTQ